MPPPNDSPDNSYHHPKTVEELTAQNVKSIANLERAAQVQLSSADRITRFCGSMAFVWVHVLWFSVWIIANTVMPIKPLDPYPFSFLTLVVSLEAIFLSTFILISENRQARIDERRNHLDLQINLLAEQENTKTLQLLEQIANKLEVWMRKRILMSKCWNKQPARTSFWSKSIKAWTKCKQMKNSPKFAATREADPHHALPVID
jgi:uncharacterized membrane protein